MVIFNTSALTLKITFTSVVLPRERKTTIKTMDKLFDWGFSAMDKMISQRHTGRGEPTCPGGTFPSGYVRDPWGSWGVLCLSDMAVEDVEDIYLLAFMLTGQLIAGVCLTMIYLKITQLNATFQREVKIPTEGLLRSMRIQLEQMSGEVKLSSDNLHKSLKILLDQMSSEAKQSCDLLLTSMTVKLALLSDETQAKMNQKMESIRELLITQLQEGSGKRKTDSDKLLATITDVIQDQIKWNLDIILRNLTRQRRDFDDGIEQIEARHRREAGRGAMVPIRRRRAVVAPAEVEENEVEEGQ